jgi:hypothetical protein
VVSSRCATLAEKLEPVQGFAVGTQGLKRQRPAFSAASAPAPRLINARGTTRIGVSPNPCSEWPASLIHETLSVEEAAPGSEAPDHDDARKTACGDDRQSHVLPASLGLGVLDEVVKPIADHCAFSNTLCFNSMRSRARILKPAAQGIRNSERRLTAHAQRLCPRESGSWRVVARSSPSGHQVRPSCWTPSKQ